MKMKINEVDKVCGFLAQNEFIYEKQRCKIFNSHTKLNFTKNGVWVTMTSKQYTEQDSLDGMSEDNIECYVKELAEQKGIITTADTFSNMPVCWIDCKKRRTGYIINRNALRKRILNHIEEMKCFGIPFTEKSWKQAGITYDAEKMKYYDIEFEEE